MTKVLKHKQWTVREKREKVKQYRLARFFAKRGKFNAKDFYKLHGVTSTMLAEWQSQENKGLFAPELHGESHLDRIRLRPAVTMADSLRIINAILASRFQAQMKIFEVRLSEHGFGLFVKKALRMPKVKKGSNEQPASEALLEYLGELVPVKNSHEVCGDFVAQVPRSKAKNTLAKIKKLGEEFSAGRMGKDGSRFDSSPARYINHSAKPNFRMSATLKLYQIKDLEKNEEVTISYGADYWKGKAINVSTKLRETVLEIAQQAEDAEDSDGFEED